MINKNHLKLHLSLSNLTLSSLAAALLIDGSAYGQETQKQNVSADKEENKIQTSQEIVVQGGIGFRNRTDEAEPVLIYDSDYFQRFEPLTAGDALKRVPSVTFQSDVLESDGARLRGLPPSYTQILINGEKVPGSNADRSFFVDRIPAELISRIEIVRSSSARRTGDAVAGTLNIQLRDGYQLDGGYIRAGGLLFNDGNLEPSLGAVYGGKLGPGRLLAGGNIQGRYNPKLKTSLRFSDSPENNPEFLNDDFDNREDQIDTRSGTDYSLNATYTIDGENSDFEINGFYVHTDRLEDERSFEYDDISAISGPVPVGNLLSDNANVNDINQENYSFNGSFRQKWELGRTALKLGIARFDERQNETEFEIDFDRVRPRFTQDITSVEIIDREFYVKLEHEFEISPDINFIIGGLYQDKDRDTNIADNRIRFDTGNDPAFLAGLVGYDQFSRNPNEFAISADPLEPLDGGFNNLQETRFDGFALIEGYTGRLSWEAGIRYESTQLDINDFTVDAADASQENDYDLFLPSASIKFELSDRDRLNLSFARTNRRPQFDFVSPALLEAELGDNDLLGNPQLDPETAWGFDLGYERRLGLTGVVGLNIFYRDVSNLIEVTNTGIEGSEGEGTSVFQPFNTGDGIVYGAEFDLSTSLAFIGLPETGIFGNLSILESEIIDFAGERRFNGQSNFVYNFGFIQNLPKLGAAFGATYRKQGDGFDRLVGEEVTTSFGADLEIFVEKRFGNNITIRFVGSNLLDATKDEVFNKFNTLEDQFNRNFDEFELESEEAGPVFQLIARLAF